MRLRLSSRKKWIFGSGSLWTKMQRRHQQKQVDILLRIVTAQGFRRRQRDVAGLLNGERRLDGKKPGQLAPT